MKQNPYPRISWGTVLMKMRWIIIALLLLVITTVVNSAPVEEVNGRHYPISMTVLSGGEGSDKPETVGVHPGDYFMVVLYAAGGTGYHWELMNKNLVLVDLVDKTAVPLDKLLHLPGGHVKWTFVLQMKAFAVGEEPLLFCLKRYRDEQEKSGGIFSLTVTAQ